MMDKHKVYRAELTLGVETDTQDAFGSVIRECKVNAEDCEIINAIKSFCGKYMQVPPMYSAIKIKGKRLYELARKGIEVERSAREVEIYYINIINLSHNKVIFDVSCSKGTYIRTLCSDIGKKLGCGGYMSFLIRMAVGPLDISSALTLEDVSDYNIRNQLESKVINVDTIFDNFCSIKLDTLEEKPFLNGMSIKMKNKNLNPGDLVRVYSMRGRFLALGEITANEEGMLMKVKKFF
jgi:tRNA pseudouridine55 synthase